MPKVAYCEGQPIVKLVDEVEQAINVDPGVVVDKQDPFSAREPLGKLSHGPLSASQLAVLRVVIRCFALQLRQRANAERRIGLVSKHEEVFAREGCCPGVEQRLGASFQAG